MLCSIFAIDELERKFVKCARQVYTKCKHAKLPFAIANTDPINQAGTHWFSLIKLQDDRGNITGDSIFMFDSFGLVGLSSFVIQDDSKLIANFMTDLETENEENMINIYSFTFLPNVFLSLSDSKRARLSVTCRGLLNFLTAFAISQNLDYIKDHGVRKQLQLKDTATCGVFQLFLLDKTYQEVDDTICKQHINCTIVTIRDILDLHFVAGTTQKRILNEQRIAAYIKEYNIPGNY